MMPPTQQSSHLWKSPRRISIRYTIGTGIGLSASARSWADAQLVCVARVQQTLLLVPRIPADWVLETNWLPATQEDL